ncbi:hypothetical protein [Lysobacter sp. F6437]|uniref:hypothetical protein n=1 Tax=Lysobacter sp. F6437 TaxID=3459296 RepID=UPI00403DE72F
MATDFPTHQKWRIASLILGAMSVLIPASFFAYMRAEFLQPDPSRGAEFCGMPLLGALLLSLVVCFVLSMIAVVIGAVSYSRLASPRSLSRRLELFAIGLPALVMLAIALAAAIFE